MKKDSYYKKLEDKGYYDNIDKRSKDYREYKEWKSKFNDNQEKGLGDAVEKITKATGIKKVVEAITDDCGCDERKEKLNKYNIWGRRKVNCISEEDYNWYVSENIASKTKWSFDERERLVSVYNSIFNTNVKNSKCSSCINGYKRNLVKYIEIYNS